MSKVAGHCAQGVSDQLLLLDCQAPILDMGPRPLYVTLHFVRIDHGVWCILYDAWCMVYDAWGKVYGVWCMVHGLWCMVYGVWCIVHGV